MLILGPTHDVLSTYKNLAFHAASRDITVVSVGLPDTKCRHWEEDGLHFDDPFYCNKLAQPPFCLQSGANRNVRSEKLRSAVHARWLPKEKVKILLQLKGKQYKSPCLHKETVGQEG